MKLINFQIVGLWVVPRGDGAGGVEVVVGDVDDVEEEEQEEAKEGHEEDEPREEECPALQSLSPHRFPVGAAAEEWERRSKR